MMQPQPSFRFGDLVCVMHFTRFEVKGDVWLDEVRKANGQLQQPPEMYMLVRDYDYQSKGSATLGAPVFAPISWLAAKHFDREQYEAVAAEVERLRHARYADVLAAAGRNRVFLDHLPQPELEAA